MASEMISSEKQLFCAISNTRITKPSFYIAMELDTDILKIVQLLIWI